MTLNTNPLQRINLIRNLSRGDNILLFISYGHQAAHAFACLSLAISIYWYQKERVFSWPFLFPLCATSSGILCARTSSYPLLLASTAFALFIVSLTLQKKTFSFGLFWYLIGTLLLFLQYNEHSLLGSQLFNKNISLTGTIKASTHQPKTFIYYIHVIKIEEEGKSKNSSFYITLYTQSKTLQTGDLIKICNTKLTPPNNKSDGSPCSFADHLIRTHTLCSSFSTKKESILLLNRPATSFARWIEEKREELVNKIANLAQQPLASFIQLIFFGAKSSGAPETMKIACLQWGITHYLARSGLHIALLILIWTYFFSLIPIHLFFKRLILICMGTIYHLFSYSSISFIRALFLFLFATTGKAFRYSIDGAHLLLLICLSTIASNPIQLFFLDFQLTFLLTFCLIASAGRPNNQDS